MAFICLFFPAVILCFTRESVFKNRERPKTAGRKRLLTEYVCACVFLNLLLFTFLAVFRRNTEQIPDKLNTSAVFAVKYLASAVSAAVLAPLAEKWLRSRFTLSVERGGGRFPNALRPSSRGLPATGFLCWRFWP